MLKEFKEFAMRGNVLDMAVGIIVGAAFGQIVTSFVQDVLMPPIGQASRPRRFLQSIYQPIRDALRHDRRRKSGRGRDAELRPLSEHGHQFSDRGVCGVPVGARSQSPRAEAGAGRGRSRHARLPLLPEQRAGQGDQVRALHVGASAGVKQHALLSVRVVLASTQSKGWIPCHQPGCAGSFRLMRCFRRVAAPASFPFPNSLRTSSSGR